MSHTITTFLFFLQGDCVGMAGIPLGDIGLVCSYVQRLRIFIVRDTKIFLNLFPKSHTRPISPGGIPAIPTQSLSLREKGPRGSTHVVLIYILYTGNQHYCLPPKTVNISHRYNTKSACTCGNYSQLQALSIIVPIQFQILNTCKHDYSLFS